jgi:hypothetical protein
VAVGSIIIIVVLVAIAELLSGLGKSSNSQRDIVIAQNLATKELATLRAQAVATNGFPPSDVSGTPSPLAGSTLTAVQTTTYGGYVFYTYAAGGWCTLSTSSGVGTWGSYTSSSNTPTATSPATYLVAVVMTWGRNVSGLSNTVSISSTNQVISSSPHLVVVSGITIPTGQFAPTPSSTASVCPAVLT